MSSRDALLRLLTDTSAQGFVYVAARHVVRVSEAPDGRVGACCWVMLSGDSDAIPVRGKAEVVAQLINDALRDEETP